MGFDSALELARAAAGDKDVGVWGGANIMRLYLKAGLLDEMQLHLIPILLGDGIRLFEDLDPERVELRRTSSIETPGAPDSKWRSDRVIPASRLRRPPSPFRTEQRSSPSLR
jgi:dihydrofolate reductase